MATDAKHFTILLPTAKVAAAVAVVAIAAVDNDNIYYDGNINYGCCVLCSSQQPLKLSCMDACGSCHCVILSACCSPLALLASNAGCCSALALLASYAGKIVIVFFLLLHTLSCCCCSYLLPDYVDGFLTILPLCTVNTDTRFYSLFLFLLNIIFPQFAY